MALDVRMTPYGAPAYDALREVVAAAQQQDAMAPVTLLVPTNLCGTVARRTLAAGLREGGPPGIAALTVLTVDRLCELLAAPRLTGQGRRPATGPVLSAAWRRALATGPGLFRDVADHPASVTALVAAHRTLRDLSAEAIDAVAGSGRLPADVVRLHRDVVRRLADRWYDAADLRSAARTHLAQPDAVTGLGTVVVFLPQDVDRGAASVVTALANVTEVHVIAGVTGDARADSGVFESLSRIGAAATPPAVTPPSTATRVSHASDSDDEVRAVVRDVVAGLRTTPAHRVAVLYGSTSPYARLLHEHLAAAGITVNGPGVRPTIERVLPRAFLELLALAEDGLDRASVFRFLSGANVRDGNRGLVPASRWERISRTAGVVGDRAWDPRLQRYAAQERRRADDERSAEAPRDGLVERYERNADAAEALRAFISHLDQRLDAGRQARGWTAVATWALETFHALLGVEADHRRLPDEERRAAERVERTLAGLSGLETIEPGADLAALREVVELEFADDLPRAGRFGTGVLVAPLSAAVGLALDRVFVVGLAEGLCPGRIREDALLPDRARQAAAGELPAVRDRLDRQHRHLLVAFAAAPDVTASFPRGDLRRSGDRLPSRWLLPTLRELTGVRDLDATHWEQHSSRDITGSASYAATVTTTPAPATEQDWRLRTITAGGRAGLPGDKALDRATALLEARHSDDFTRYDGNLGAYAGVLPDPADGARIVSPTSLEAWVSCPHAYFLQRILHVEPIEQPEELLKISPLEVGSLLHHALDRFFQWLTDSNDIPGPDDPWTKAHRTKLREIGEIVADEFRDRGVTGHPTIWERERMLVLDVLLGVLDQDEGVRRESRRRQLRSELRFGGGSDGGSVDVKLPDGRTVRFRGSADRVDEHDDGTLVVVDYKSGKADHYKGLSEADPDKQGSRLQLPVYGYAARQVLGRPDAPVRAEYWFIRRNERDRQIGYSLTPEVEQRYAKVLTTIVNGIAGGLFPANVPEDRPWSAFPACAYCDPDGLGAKDRRVQWMRKKSAPDLAAYLALTEPDGVEALEGPTP